MNCHKNSKESQGTHKHNPLKHIFHMIICCGLPIVIIGLLPIISRLNPSVGGIIAKIAPFICPLMMLIMVAMMIINNRKGKCCNTKKHNDDIKKSI